MKDEVIILEPNQQQKARFSVIWMHGLGADATDFADIDNLLPKTRALGVRYLLPNAPYRNVTINGGMQMRAWYDIKSMEMIREVDLAGLMQSANTVRTLMQQEMNKGIDCKHIVIAGFSQGGAVALYTALTHNDVLGGVIALSTYYPHMDNIHTDGTEASKSTPIFSAHGIHDNVVSHQAGKLTRQTMQKLGYKMDCYDYPISHSLCEEELEHIDTWMSTTLG